MAKAETIERKWYVIDAAGQPIGKTAVKAAEEAGLTVNIAAPNEKSKSMAEAMDLYFKENADK